MGDFQNLWIVYSSNSITEFSGIFFISFNLFNAAVSKRPFKDLALSDCIEHQPNSYLFRAAPFEWVSLFFLFFLIQVSCFFSFFFFFCLLSFCSSSFFEPQPNSYSFRAGELLFSFLLLFFFLLLFLESQPNIYLFKATPFGLVFSSFCFLSFLLNIVFIFVFFLFNLIHNRYLFRAAAIGVSGSHKKYCMSRLLLTFYWSQT